MYTVVVLFCIGTEVGGKGGDNDFYLEKLFKYLREGGITTSQQEYSSAVDLNVIGLQARSTAIKRDHERA